jgi:iron complex transport system substrate-binding protein
MRPVWIYTATALVAFGCVVGAADPPQRIVSLAPNLTEMLIKAGVDGRLVAVTPFCEAPEEIPRLPGGILPESEQVLALEPDLVLATPMTPLATRRQLAHLGLRVEAIDTASLGEIRTAMTRVAALLGTEASLPIAAPGKKPAQSAVLLFGADTTYTAGCGTHAHEILEAAGLRNIAAAAGGPWPQLGEESLLAADPDLIIVADYGDTDRAGVMNTLRKHPLRRHLAAVRSGRVIVFPAPLFSVPGPAALEAGAKLLAEVDKL